MINNVWPLHSIKPLGTKEPANCLIVANISSTVHTPLIIIKYNLTTY